MLYGKGKLGKYPYFTQLTQVALFLQYQINLKEYSLLEVKAMSSLLLKELATKGTIEKLETVLTLSNILLARSPDSSSQEAFLCTITNLLEDAIQCLKPRDPIVITVPRDASVCPCPLYQSCDKCKKFEPRTKKPAPEYKEITIKPAGDSTVCPCDDCMKSKPRKRTWTAQQKAEHSAHLKGLWAAKKAAKAVTIPL